MKQLKKKVIHRSNLPVNLPLFQTLVTALALDYWNAPQWICGSIGVILCLAWGNAIINICKNTEIDLFPDLKDTEKEGK